MSVARSALWASLKKKSFYPTFKLIGIKIIATMFTCLPCARNCMYFMKITSFNLHNNLTRQIFLVSFSSQGNWSSEWLNGYLKVVPRLSARGWIQTLCNSKAYPATIPKKPNWNLTKLESGRFWRVQLGLKERALTPKMILQCDQGYQLTVETGSPWVSILKVSFSLTLLKITIEKAVW